MENREELLDALNDFNRKQTKEIPPLLEQYLKQVAKTGETLFPWSQLKILILAKMEQVMVQFCEEYGSDHLPPCPNVENVRSEVVRNRIMETVQKFHGAPFTIQRLCELLTDPKRHYKRCDKFLRGLEKNVLVVSTVDPFGRKVVSESKNMVNGMDNNSSFQQAESSTLLSTPPVPVWNATSPTAWHVSVECATADGMTSGSALESTGSPDSKDATSSPTVNFSQVIQISPAALERTSDETKLSVTETTNLNTIFNGEEGQSDMTPTSSVGRSENSKQSSHSEKMVGDTELGQHCQTTDLMEVAVKETLSVTEPCQLTEATVSDEPKVKDYCVSNLDWSCNKMTAENTLEGSSLHEEASDERVKILVQVNENIKEATQSAEETEGSKDSCFDGISKNENTVCCQESTSNMAAEGNSATVEESFVAVAAKPCDTTCLLETPTVGVNQEETMTKQDEIGSSLAESMDVGTTDVAIEPQGPTENIPGNTDHVITAAAASSDTVQISAQEEVAMEEY